MTISVHQHISPRLHLRSSIEKNDFAIQNNINESYFYQHFLAVCHTCTVKGLSLKPTEHTSSFLEAVQSLMPHWTPNNKDNVVYATIEEASSSSLTDIESYLAKLKQDLKIGATGATVKVPIAGDQQTYYAFMKKLQKKNPDHYSWMIILHGDWHMLQLLAELIRDILWDGGFKQMCSQCGYKKMPTQWQEIHLLLMALCGSVSTT